MPRLPPTDTRVKFLRYNSFSEGVDARCCLPRIENPAVIVMDSILATAGMHATRIAMCHHIPSALIHTLITSRDMIEKLNEVHVREAHLRALHAPSAPC